MTPEQLFDDLIYNPNKTGWHFGWGDPEFWRMRGDLVVPGGKAVNLGCGRGRSSVFFALNGMEVIGYDNNPECVRDLQALVMKYQLPIQVKHEDIRQADLGDGIYDTAILAQVLVHFPNKEEALEVVDKAYRALKVGGKMWLRAAGKEDGSYELLKSAGDIAQGENHNHPDVIYYECSCSGTLKVEPFLFFGTDELIWYLSSLGARIKHTQVAPDDRSTNIMYGEDWPCESYGPHGMVTIVAEKRG